MDSHMIIYMLSSEATDSDLLSGCMSCNNGHNLYGYPDMSIKGLFLGVCAEQVSRYNGVTRSKFMGSSINICLQLLPITNGGGTGLLYFKLNKSIQEFSMRVKVYRCLSYPLLSISFCFIYLFKERGNDPIKYGQRRTLYDQGLIKAEGGFIPHEESSGISSSPLY